MKKHSLAAYWPVIDGHADTLVKAAVEKRRFSRLSREGHLDLPRLYQAGVDLQVLAICAGTREEPYRWAAGLLDSWEREYETVVSEVVWVRTADDFRVWESGDKVGVILALEGLEPLEGEIGRVEEFYSRGIRIASLTWNWANQFASGANCQNDQGLTILGRELVLQAQSLGLLLDLSHLGPKSFMDLLSLVKKPVIVSHANVYDLQPHRRNLRLEQIKAVASTGGTVGITFYPPFIGEGEIACDRLIPHLEYIIKHTGEDAPAIGGDFDGMDTTPVDLKQVNDLKNLAESMERAGFGSEIRGKILGKNLYRVLKEAFS